MAKLIPIEFNDINESKAEGLVFKELNKSFDNSWTIFHSYSFEFQNKEKKLLDAEIDFLLLNKYHGLLVLEVKGGKIKYEKGNWTQNEMPIQDPYEQAKRNKFKIKNHLKAFLRGEPPISFAHAVIFPDYFGSDKSIPHKHIFITLTAEDLKKLNDSIVLILKKQRNPGYLIDQVMFNTIETALLQVFECGSTIIDIFGIEKRKVFNLTEQQCELLSFISDHKHALIKGCAGSGKTIMAVKKAKQLANEGNQVLLLCFNVMLAERLANEVKDSPNITVSSYHFYCEHELKKAGISVDDTLDISDRCKKEIPEKFLDLIADRPIKYDAVIVDEGQDFLEEYWFTVSELVKPDGYYYIFYDPDQNIFDSSLKLPELSKPFILNKNCRNTKKIFSELQNFATMKLRIDPNAPEGTDICKYRFDNRLLLIKQLDQILYNLIYKERLREEQIVILGTHQVSHTSLEQYSENIRFQIKENGPPGKQVIAYYSCMKFKGLESDVVILIDFEDKRWKKPGITYTAFSRARHQLFILEGPCKEK